MTVQKISISIDRDIFEAIEKMRGNKTRFRSEYINAAIREKMGLDKTEPRGAPPGT